LPVKKITQQFNYSKKDLIELVLRIDDYKEFLPWCINSKILTINKDKQNLNITADLEIGFKSFKEIYTSMVIYNHEKSKIEVTCLKGNIKKLLNIWEFKKIDDKSCSVDFFIDIELKNPIINILFAKFFNYGFDKILDSFQQRAKYAIKD
jgi:coenzyme Q-binding protein COQ10